MPGSQVSLPPRDPKCFSVCSFHLSFDWVEASSLPGINIHNKQRAINLTSWNLLCTRLNSKPASAGCLFFIIDALHMTAPKHPNLKHTVVQNSCCPRFLLPDPLKSTELWVSPCLWESLTVGLWEEREPWDGLRFGLHAWCRDLVAHFISGGFSQ